MLKTLESSPLADWVELDSAGTTGFHEGAKVDPRMQNELRSREIPVRGHSRPVHPDDYARFDLILAMDEDNLEDLREGNRDQAPPSAIRLFGEFCSQRPGVEIPDPYYGGEDGFAQVVDLLEDGCRGLLAFLEKEKRSRC